MLPPVLHQGVFWLVSPALQGRFGPVLHVTSAYEADVQVSEALLSYHSQR